MDCELKQERQDTEKMASRIRGANGKEVGVGRTGGEIRTGVSACLCSRKSRQGKPSMCVLGMQNLKDKTPRKRRAGTQVDLSDDGSLQKE